MNFVVVGTNHKYSPMELRERISFSRKSLIGALDFFKGNPRVKGAVILSTCNRIEIYASTRDEASGIREIQDFISRYHEIERRKLLPYLYIRAGRGAISHLFSVASGLDSLVLGERQISGQVRRAFMESEKYGITDEVLENIFPQAVSFAGRIHGETKISEGKVSVGSVAIDFIKGKLGSLSQKNILIIGVGKVTELVLKYLKKEAPNVLFVSNRTFVRAKHLARSIGAKAVRFCELERFLEEADVVIAATASPHFIIKKETLEKVAARREMHAGGKLFIIDLALPRNVDPRIKDLENVELFCLEDLNTAIEENIGRKLSEAEKVKKIIALETENIWKKITESEPEPALLP